MPRAHPRTTTSRASARDDGGATGRALLVGSTRLGSTLLRSTLLGSTLVAAIALTGCTGSTHQAGGGTAPTTVATRWWSDGNVSAGTTIDPAHPTAGAAGLSPDRHSYCAILSSTLAAGHNVLQGVSAGNPVLATTTRAWLADLQGVAPDPLASDWKVMSGAILALISSGDSPAAAHLPSGVSQASVSSASQAIAADAKSNCSLDLSSTSDPSASTSPTN